MIHADLFERFEIGSQVVGAELQAEMNGAWGSLWIVNEIDVERLLSRPEVLVADIASAHHRDEPVDRERLVVHPAGHARKADDELDQAQRSAPSRKPRPRAPAKQRREAKPLDSRSSFAEPSEDRRQRQRHNPAYDRASHHHR